MCASQRINELQGRLTRAKQVLHSFKVEMRDLPRELVPQYDGVYNDFHERLQVMHGELSAALQDAQRASLGVRTVDEMSTQEVLKEASSVQEKSLQSIGRMRQQIEVSKEVGAQTAIRLKDQTEQMKAIDTDVMKVKSNLSRADLLIRAFMRKMMTDKIIMGFMCLIFVGVVVIIVYKIAVPDEEESSNTVGAPPSSPPAPEPRIEPQRLRTPQEPTSSDRVHLRAVCAASRFAPEPAQQQVVQEERPNLRAHQTSVRSERRAAWGRRARGAARPARGAWVARAGAGPGA